MCNKIFLDFFTRHFVYKYTNLVQLKLKQLNRKGKKSNKFEIEMMKNIYDFIFLYFINTKV